MNVEKIVVDRRKALELYRAYKTHQHYSQPIDQEIQRTYKMIAQGRVVVKALESIRAAGVNVEGLPKLAITNALATDCHLYYPKWLASSPAGALCCQTLAARSSGWL